MNQIRSGLLLATCLLLAWSGEAAAEKRLLKAGMVFTMTGPPLQPGAVFVEDGKIIKVATSINVADDVEQQDLGDTVLIPGIVNSYGQLGVNGGTSEYTLEVTPDFDPSVAIDWRSRQFRESRDEGVTCVAVAPGTDNVIAGQSLVVKTAGSSPEDRIVAKRNGLVLTLASDPESRNRSRTRPDSIYVRQPTNRMGVVWILRSTLFATLQEGVHSDKVLQQALARQRRLFCVTRTQYDIESLLSVSDEFGLAPTIIGGLEAYKLADQLAERNVGVILEPIRTFMTTDREGTDAFWNRPGVLDKAGVTFALSGPSLLDQARFAVRFGLDRDKALQTITSTPAELLGVAERVGSIAVGRDADIVVLDGDPLAFTTRVQSVMVDGVFYDNEGVNHD